MSKKHKAHEEDHIDKTWLIPYADLFTLLLALFIVLFASSSLDAKKFDKLMVTFNDIFSGGTGILEQAVPVGDPTIASNQKAQDDKEKLKQQSENQEELKKEPVDLENLKKQIDNYIKENNLTSQLATTLDTQQLPITIRDNALFASGSATLKEEAKTLAVAISKLLQNYLQYEIIVSGHTDNRPIHTAEFSSNWYLSTERALNFMVVLLLNEEVGPERFRAMGIGEYKPVTTNDTDEGRSINRRVKVSIIRNFTTTPPQVVGAE